MRNPEINKILIEQPICLPRLKSFYEHEDRMSDILFFLQSCKEKRSFFM